jgi:hypothetical protein
LVALLGADPFLLFWLLGGLQGASPGRELPTTTITRHLSLFTYRRVWLDCLPTRNCWMCLGGELPALLRLHVASSGHATNAPYASLSKQFVLQSSMCLRAQRKRSNFRDGAQKKNPKRRLCCQRGSDDPRWHRGHTLSCPTHLCQVGRRSQGPQRLIKRQKVLSAHLHVVAWAYKLLYIWICWDNWLCEEGLRGRRLLDANKV